MGWVLMQNHQIHPSNKDAEGNGQMEEDAEFVTKQQKGPSVTRDFNFPPFVGNFLVVIFVEHDHGTESKDNVPKNEQNL